MKTQKHSSPIILSCVGVYATCEVRLVCNSCCPCVWFCHNWASLRWSLRGAKSPGHPSRTTRRWHLQLAQAQSKHIQIDPKLPLVQTSAFSKASFQNNGMLFQWNFKYCKQVVATHQPSKLWYPLHHSELAPPNPAAAKAKSTAWETERPLGKFCFG